MPSALTWEAPKHPPSLQHSAFQEHKMRESQSLCSEVSRDQGEGRGWSDGPHICPHTLRGKKQVCCHAFVKEVKCVMPLNQHENQPSSHEPGLQKKAHLTWCQEPLRCTSEGIFCQRWGHDEAGKEEREEGRGGRRQGKHSVSISERKVLSLVHCL